MKEYQSLKDSEMKNQQNYLKENFDNVIHYHCNSCIIYHRQKDLNHFDKLLNDKSETIRQMKLRIEKLESLVNSLINLK